MAIIGLLLEVDLARRGLSDEIQFLHQLDREQGLSQSQSACYSSVGVPEVLPDSFYNIPSGSVCKHGNGQAHVAILSNRTIRSRDTDGIVFQKPMSTLNVLEHAHGLPYIF